MWIECYDYGLQFTKEMEINRKPPFLDMQIHVINGILKTEWYAKPYSSGRLLNYLSMHPMNQRMATVTGFMEKVVSLTDTQFLPIIVRRLTSILRRNNYPEGIIEDIFQRWERGEKANSRKSEEERRYVSMTYIPGYTNKIAKTFKDRLNVDVAMRASNTVRSICPMMKDKVPLNKRSNIIYSIPCTRCKDVYIGQIKRYLGTRIQEHVKSVEKIWSNPEIGPNTGECAVAQHYRNLEHAMDFDKVSILDTERCLRKRLILEGIHIMSTRHTCNHRSDVDRISSTYAKLIAIETNHNEK